MIAFLLLNYKNMEETEKCIDSIFEINEDDSHIVIVDNGSQDGSVERMHSLYGSNDRIHVIESDTNVGFSKGNNLGYSYIRERLAPDFVVVSNNDVLFPQKNMTQIIYDVYRKTGFYVLGPDIYVRANKEHQSPIRLSLPTRTEIEKELQMYEYYSNYPEKWANRRNIQTIKNKIIQSNRCLERFYNRIRKKDNINHSISYENCCVQGACIIVSKDYLTEEPKMFTPEPFLYCEEVMLHKKCLEKGYKIVYDPIVQIWHEDSSTMIKINNNAVERAKFTLKNHVAARKMLLDLL